MNTLLGGIALMSGLVATLALWWAYRLRREVERLKRNEYYTESKLKGVSRQIFEAIEPLRIQLAKVASGAFVPEDLIRTGRLYRDVTAQEAQTMIQAGQGSTEAGVVVVDVRSAKEYATKHVLGAKLIPIEELETRYQAEIPQDAQKVFIYCAGGDRSRLACDFLSRLGHLNLYNIRDGLQQWRGPTIGEEPLHLIQIHHKSQRR